ncbi:ISKra4 family transposase [Candidatus Sumerlaeota bacterium]|nr:ISKra4 family transposase [Candidatus Sumerlaeota bacterium]
MGAKTLRTLLGDVRILRPYFVCPECDATRCPADEQLAVVNTGFSPGARRIMAKAASMEAFSTAAQDLYLFSHLSVGPKDVERVAQTTGRGVELWDCQQRRLRRAQPSRRAVLLKRGENPMPPATLYVQFDGTGVPMRREELTHTKGKSPDGKAKTREVKLGCVFTQTTLDDQGWPVRDPNSTTYVGDIESSADFGYRIHGEMVRRSGLDAAQVVVITDGAAYNKSIVAERFPTALHIIDLYHARERLADFVRSVLGRPTSDPLYFAWRDLLDQGDIAALLQQLQQALPRSGPRRKIALAHITYFRDNAHLMHYNLYRRRGLFVGSGVIEAACKTIVAARLKKSGMFWSLRGANAIIALRCNILSNRFEQFWEQPAP